MQKRKVIRSTTFFVLFRRLLFQNILILFNSTRNNDERNECNEGNIKLNSEIRLHLCCLYNLWKIENTPMHTSTSHVKLSLHKTNWWNCESIFHCPCCSIFIRDKTPLCSFSSRDSEVKLTIKLKRSHALNSTILNSNCAPKSIIFLGFTQTLSSFYYPPHRNSKLGNLNISIHPWYYNVPRIHLFLVLLFVKWM